MVRCRKTNFRISVIRPDRSANRSFFIVRSAASGDTQSSVHYVTPAGTHRTSVSCPRSGHRPCVCLTDPQGMRCRLVIAPVRYPRKWTRADAHSRGRGRLSPSARVVVAPKSQKETALHVSFQRKVAVSLPPGPRRPSELVPIQVRTRLPPRQ